MGATRIFRVSALNNCMALVLELITAKQQLTQVATLQARHHTVTIYQKANCYCDATTLSRLSGYFAHDLCDDVIVPCPRRTTKSDACAKESLRKQERSVSSWKTHHNTDDDERLLVASHKATYIKLP